MFEYIERFQNSKDATKDRQAGFEVFHPFITVSDFGVEPQRESAERTDVVHVELRADGSSVVMDASRQLNGGKVYLAHLLLICGVGDSYESKMIHMNRVSCMGRLSYM